MLEFKVPFPIKYSVNSLNKPKYAQILTIGQICEGTDGQANFQEKDFPQKLSPRGGGPRGQKDLQKQVLFSSRPYLARVRIGWYLGHSSIHIGILSLYE